MKRISAISLIILSVSLSTLAYGQSKIGWFNSKTVLEKLPEAQDAQRQLDNFVAEWQGDLAKMQNEWQKKFQEYDKKKLILTDQLRVDAEKELQDLDKKISDYRNKKFGQNGELFLKQNDIMKPIQNKIFKALQELATEDEYDYIFDKSGDILLMYSNDKYDLTLKVIERMTSYDEK